MPVSAATVNPTAGGTSTGPTRTFRRANSSGWRRTSLRQPGKTVVFIHQRLDVAGHYGVKNAAAVRDVLGRSGNVAAVFQGHNHINDYKEIDAIHYVTLTAVVTGTGVASNAYCPGRYLPGRVTTSRRLPPAEGLSAGLAELHADFRS